MFGFHVRDEGEVPGRREDGVYAVTVEVVVDPLTCT